MRARGDKACPEISADSRRSLEFEQEEGRRWVGGGGASMYVGVSREWL